MKIQTLSIIAGSEACNARCPFCVSRMTPPQGVELKEPDVNWRNFRKACQFAKQSRVTTAMITGKGEPTLFPGQISKYLEEMLPYEFPFVELQTNGIPLAERRERYDPLLGGWYDNGLTTVAISIVHYEPEKNREIYVPYKKEYIDLPELIQYLHEKKFSVRLAAVMLNGFVDGAGELEKLVAFGKEHKVEQLSVRPADRPQESRDGEAYEWIRKHQLKPEQLEEVKAYLTTEGTELMRLMHGAIVYDVRGQNVCLTNCLTLEPSSEKIRQLIFFPDGHLRYDWQYEGAILL